MQCFDKIDASEGFNVNKISASEQCIICHYWYFLIKDLSFNHHFNHVCNCCHDVSMMST